MTPEEFKHTVGVRLEDTSDDRLRELREMFTGAIEMISAELQARAFSRATVRQSSDKPDLTGISTVLLNFADGTNACHEDMPQSVVAADTIFLMRNKRVRNPNGRYYTVPDNRTFTRGQACADHVHFHELK